MSEEIEAKIKENIPLAPLTTFKVGGPAKFFVSVYTAEELVAAIKWAKKKKLPHQIIAGGSNILVSDQGYQGLIIKMDNNEVLVHGQRIECGAGANLGQVVTKATSQNLSGLEWAAGIPGSVGGAIRGNAGAFGRSINEIIENVKAINSQEMSIMVLSHTDCRFAYRHSRFKDETQLIIWQAILRLYPRSSSQISQKVQEHLDYRANTQPNLPSAGCTFKNLEFIVLQKINPELSQIAQAQGIVKGGKVSTGWLINQLDIAGKKIGGAKISLEHCNFVVNAGRATASDIVMLIGYIKQQARERFGVILIEEVQYIE